MNHKQKLIYMALGCLFTLIGYTLATLNTNVTAQTAPSNATFDKITCRELVITLDERGVTNTKIGPGSLLLEGPQRRAVFIDSQMGVRVGGGKIILYDQHEKGSILLSSDQDGGAIAIFNKGGENVIQAGVNKQGHGIIQTHDKHGYLTGKLP